MNKLICILLVLTLSGCGWFDQYFTKKEQLRLEVPSELMAPPRDLEKL